MHKMRQIRQPNHFGTRDHVQGIRLVYYGLLRQDETTDRGNQQTDTHGNDNGADRVVRNSRSGFVIDTRCVTCATGFRRNDQLVDSICQQRARVQHHFRPEVG